MKRLNLGTVCKKSGIVKSYHDKDKPQQLLSLVAFQLHPVGASTLFHHEPLYFSITVCQRIDGGMRLKHPTKKKIPSSTDVFVATMVAEAIEWASDPEIDLTEVAHN